VRHSSIGPNDTILEIGPGKGIITRQLLAVARQVIAVEIDKNLVEYLLQGLANAHLTLFHTDFFQFPLPRTPYKVFANLPFHIEGEVVRKLLEADNPPEEAQVVVLRDVGYRWSGFKCEGVFSLLYKPWFEMTIAYHFKRSDFVPKPKLKVAMLRIVKRREALIGNKERKEYAHFLRIAFGGGGRINKNLSECFGKRQLGNLAAKLGFSVFAKPSELNLKQWLGLFENFRRQQKPLSQVSKN